MCTVGEVMQLNTIKGDVYSLFDQYTEKTFKKTASLMAYSCQAVSQFGDCMYKREMLFLGSCAQSMYRRNVSICISLWEKHWVSISSEDICPLSIHTINHISIYLSAIYPVMCCIYLL